MAQGGPHSEQNLTVARKSTATSRRLAWVLGSVSILLLAGEVAILYLDRNASVPADTTTWGLAAVMSAVSNATSHRESTRARSRYVPP